MGVEHSGKEILGRRSNNAKLFERIEHSGSRSVMKNVNKLLLLLHKDLILLLANVVRLLAEWSDIKS